MNISTYQRHSLQQMATELGAMQQRLQADGFQFLAYLIGMAIMQCALTVSTGVREPSDTAPHSRTARR